MRRSIATYMLAALVAISGSALANGAPIFATYTDGASGTLDGVNFTMSGLSSPGFGAEIQDMTMAGTDWNSVGMQSGRLYNQNFASSFTITFDSPVTDLQLYLYYFRGNTSGGGGYDSYTFSESFTVTGGLTGISVTANTIDTSSVDFANGVLTFDGPVSALTVSGTGDAVGGDAGFTLAKAPAAQSTITFDSAGGSAVNAITAEVGSSVMAPTPPTREGYTFTGWLPSVPTTMPAEDLTVVAQWEAVPAVPVPSVSQSGLLLMTLLISVLALIRLWSQVSG